MRKPFVAAARGHNGKSRRARPVDEIADDRRLVAIGEAVHHCGLPRLFCKQRAAEGIRLHRDHDHVFAVAERGERVRDGGERVTRRFDHDLDCGMGHERLPVVRNMRAPLLEGPIERRCAIAVRLPPDAFEIGAGVGGREICDPGQMHPGGLMHLREVHRGELAGADHADPQRLAPRLPLTEFGMKVHTGSRATQRAEA